MEISIRTLVIVTRQLAYVRSMLQTGITGQPSARLRSRHMLSHPKGRGYHISHHFTLREMFHQQ